MKSKRLNFRVSDWQDGIIRAKADEADMSLTDYMLFCCLGKNIIKFDGLDKIETQLKRIGNNINQLTILGRQGKVDVINLDQVQNELEKYYTELLRVLRRMES